MRSQLSAISPKYAEASLGPIPLDGFEALVVAVEIRVVPGKQRHQGGEDFRRGATVGEAVEGPGAFLDTIHQVCL